MELLCTKLLTGHIFADVYSSLSYSDQIYGHRVETETQRSPPPSSIYTLCKQRTRNTPFTVV